MSNSLSSLSVRQLQQAIELKTKIEGLHAELNSIISGTKAILPSQKSEVTTESTRKPRRKMNAAARAKISAAAKLRWKKARAAGKNSL